MPPKYVEQDPVKLEKLKLFKDRLQKEITFTKYKDAGDLSERVLQDILDYISEKEKGVERGDNQDAILLLHRENLAHRLRSTR